MSSPRSRGAVGRRAALLALGLALGCGGEEAAPIVEADDAGADAQVPLDPGARGPMAAGRRSLVWVDPTRSTPAHGDEAAIDGRTLEVEIWYPADADPEADEVDDAPLAAGGPFPLVIYSHGFMSDPAENAALGRYLASHSIVTVAPGYPLTGLATPGGATLLDIANMPGDVSFAIDRILAESADASSPLAGAVDGERIAAAGLSLGGLNSVLASYHPAYADARIGATVSIAGALCMLPDEGLAGAGPLLLVNGDADRIAPYEAFGLGSWERATAPKTLVTLHGGTHLGFAASMGDLLAGAESVDEVGCQALEVAADPAAMVGFATALGAGGLRPRIAGCPLPCSDPAPDGATLTPARQGELMVMAVGAFLRAELRDEVALRDWLRETLAADEDVSVSFDDEGDPPACGVSSLGVGPAGLKLATTCGPSMDLAPRVRMDGQWHETEGACTAPGTGAIVCQTAVGAIEAQAQAGVATASFTASVGGTFEALEWAGSIDLGGATGWLSNGWQSWSQSGIVAIAGPPDPDALEADLLAVGDPEVLRFGRHHSWWHTWVGGGAHQLFAASSAAARFRSWIQVHRTEGGAVALRLVNGGVPADFVTLAAGEAVEGEPWTLALSDDIHEAALAWGAELPSRRAEHPVAADTGWNSWYELWDGVDEEAVRANADLALGILGPLMAEGPPGLRIVIDDGWQMGWGEWTPNPKFPSGLSGLAADLKADGFEVGVWLAPLLVDAQSALVADHPEWFLGGTTWKHPSQGEQRILDVTHDGARQHLADTIATIVGWGYDLLKIDFLFAGTFEGLRAAPMTGTRAYRLALETIREAAGDDTILVAVGAPIEPISDLVDVWRIGPDIALEPFGVEWTFVPAQARSIGARWPLCQALLCDADPALLRELAPNEVQAGAWTVALAGGAMFLSDDLRALAPEHPGLALTSDLIAVATSGEAAVPVDLFPTEPPPELADPLGDAIALESRHVLPSLWTLPDGRRLGLNVKNDPVEIGGVTIPGRSAEVIP